MLIKSKTYPHCEYKDNAMVSSLVIDGALHLMEQFCELQSNGGADAIKIAKP